MPAVRAPARGRDSGLNSGARGDESRSGHDDGREQAGGGGSIAGTYVAQRAADPHYLLIATSSIASNYIVGVSTLTPADFTPIAAMLQNYVVFAVAANSPLKSGRELAERLKKDPKSMAVGFANTFGASRHIAAGLLLKSLGGDPRSVRIHVRHEVAVRLCRFAMTD